MTYCVQYEVCQIYGFVWLSVHYLEQKQYIWLSIMK